MDELLRFLHSMKFPLKAVVWIALLSPVPVLADGALIVTPAAVADRVRAQNPELAAARLRIREALGRMKQAGRRENPRLETEFEHDPRFREGRFQLGFTQRFR